MNNVHLYKMKFMKGFAMLLMFASILPVAAQNNINIVPMPVDVKVIKGEPPFKIDKNTKIVLYPAGTGMEKFSDYLNLFLKNTYGFTLKVITDSKWPAKNYINISLTPPAYKNKKEYSINVNATAITLGGYEKEEVFYGLQTLIQLIESGTNVKNTEIKIPILQIADYPRFQYRGMHLDVARHFFSVDYVKKYIDYLAAYKFNTFHWHLTDDQGWRIEIKKYPLLTSVGGYRNGTIIGRYPGKGNDGMRYGGFYTQEEIKEIVKYAADRYIDVIPEIEMPGHASAAIAAYPQLSCFPNESTNVGKTPWAGSRDGKQVQQTWGVFEDVFCPSDNTFNFLQDVLDEVMPLFPSKYIHIGGDECPKESWKRSPFCQQLIKDNNLKDEHGLQSYFIQHIEKYINSKGKQIIGWDEILEGGLAPNATVMSWRGEEGGIEAAKQNHDVIMTPGAYCYLDHSQSKNEDSVTIGGYLPLEKVYGYEPIPAALNVDQAKHVLGAQGNVWTEYIGNPAKVEYMIFPRMIALSEVLWSPKAKRDWKDFERRLPAVLDRLDKKKVNYSKSYFDFETTILPSDDHESLLWLGKEKIKDNIIIFRDEYNTYYILNPFKINVADHINDTKEYTAVQCKRVLKKGGIIADHKNPISEQSQIFHFNKATGKKITIINEPSNNYPGDGAFTLVNGVQNDKGLSKGNEFLGFLGKDCEGTIDFGKPVKVRKIRVHSLNQNGSWIYPPKYIEVSSPSITGKRILRADKPLVEKDGNIVYEIDFGAETEMTTLYFKIVNFGIIPAGFPGAGTAAWLFVDEIEAE
jgi:hexosaminidase